MLLAVCLKHCLLSNECRCLAAPVTSSRSLFIFFIRIGYFDIDPAMLPSGIEKRGQRVLGLAPFSGCHPGNTRKPIFIVWQAFLLPVMHNQEHVSAMLQGAEVLRIPQVVGHIKWHPRSCQLVAPRVL